MSSISEKLKKCSLKISAEVSFVPSIGTGVLYQTPNLYDYNYVLTAKHILCEDSKMNFDINLITLLNIEYFSDESFKQLALFGKGELKLDKNILLFEIEDFVLIKIQKQSGINFPSFFVSDELEESDIKFFSWSIFKANENNFNKFKFERSDPSDKSLELKSQVTKEALNGCSGSGVFIGEKNVLYGIINKFPNSNFENAIISCSKISFETINSKLQNLNLKTLDHKSAILKKEINGKVVELYQADINGAYLDINLAIKRVNSDMFDDWYYDALSYKDLLNTDFFFAQMKDYFYEDVYQASKAEKFYVPKSNFTLREAFILPIIDRVVYMSIVGELAEIIDDSLISSVYASRFDKVNGKKLLINGVEQWLKLKYRISEQLKIKDENEKFKFNCILHIDILNYYDNIDKKLLIEKLMRIALNENHLKTISLLKKFLVSFSEKTIGLPQNNDSSALLATFYLNEVDSFMQNQTQAYFRFVDDIQILCADKYEARKYLMQVEKELKRTQLAVNSQKTKIIELDDTSNDSENSRERFHNIFNLDIDLIKVLANSANYQNRKQAFHSAIKLLIRNIDFDGNENDEKSKNLMFSLRVIEMLSKSKVNFNENKSDLIPALNSTIEKLKDSPWITYQVCKILSLLSKDDFEKKFFPKIKNLILDNKLNLYSYQQFQLWLLLAKQVSRDSDLVQLATSKLEVNDSTQIPTTASQIIYLSSVDRNFKRRLLSIFESNEFATGYFQNRACLIALRTYQLINPKKESIIKSLNESFRYTSKYANQEIVLYHTLSDKKIKLDDTEQMYSI